MEKVVIVSAVCNQGIKAAQAKASTPQPEENSHHTQQKSRCQAREWKQPVSHMVMSVNIKLTMNT